ncbi:thermonuclease family protein [Sphingomonas fennica]|uniref:Nuclease n=1 Tax=Edaphosphingomonas fennica TaxID=114404 RepID=A0A2T4HSH1_9SPHN|nr:thermonuclease family protein [Sphingomonas fennica]PTD18748.1 nuclease [Sphingomonas fennica]
MLIHGFKKWPKNQKIALPILTIFAFGSLFNQLQGRQSEPTSIFVDNPRIIDGDTLEAADEKRVRLLGIDAPDDDGNGNVTKIAAQLYLEELVKRNGGMDCTSEFQDQPLTVEPICNKSRSSWGRLNMSCRFRSNGASVSATMVRHGYAVDYRRHSGLAYARFMKEAADEKRGLWSVNYEAMRNLAIERGQLPNSCS